ncbi:ABC transporter ATP-binding protein [Leifsonia sp. Leaf264]|uniref:ABC transporter ATP-binding protein n=1 Tax=Leifsonia sp. Leaf264 TaxID=1736314 RepID=UPI0006F9EEC6|nr:ABC transporter ATP-binding protein [Leifsonia sp. Leaf264]KQP01633.1 multidrug ABC transporter ATP-binding protein [Leifsonia sp. Leaf264]
MSISGGIVVESVARSFGDVHAVRDVSLTVEPGSVAGLIGPNGSGKTTLLLMLATLVQPDSGTISIGGFDPVTDAREVRSRIGWMPDTLGAWPSLSVRSTITTTGRMYGIDREKAAVRAEELIRLVGLDALADRPARVLSRGQKQRLSLARALVHDPDVLLLDEPASGLDPHARADLRDSVRRLAGEGKAVLVSSHVLAELDEMADAAVYVSAGVTATAEAVARSERTARDWRIRAIDPAVLAPALIAAGVPVELIRTDNLGSLVPIGDEAQAARLLSALIASGVQVSSYGPAVGDLEHVFLELNRGEGSA